MPIALRRCGPCRSWRRTWGVAHLLSRGACGGRLGRRVVGLGLVLPAAIGVLEILIPFAAAGLAGVVVRAATVHLRRRETAIVPVPLLLAALAAALAALRFGPYGF